MSPISNIELFSPLDADVSLHPQFSEAFGLISSIDSTNHEYNASFHQPRPRANSIPRKPLPQYAQLKPHTHTNSFSSISTADTIEEEKLDEKSTEKRGWRFYGTFACLALLNFVCALDATILSVALPVRNTILFILAFPNILFQRPLRLASKGPQLFRLSGVEPASFSAPQSFNLRGHPSPIYLVGSQCYFSHWEFSLSAR